MELPPLLGQPFFCPPPPVKETLIEYLNRLCVNPLLIQISLIQFAVCKRGLTEVGSCYHAREHAVCTCYHLASLHVDVYPLITGVNDYLVCICVCHECFIAVRAWPFSFTGSRRPHPLSCVQRKYRLNWTFWARVTIRGSLWRKSALLFVTLQQHNQIS